uniref:Uncharacterized protein n=1 Tax=Octopus bimaculoides TaxID=37653 RepID=A0A0L8G1H3_OCTBM
MKKTLCGVMCVSCAGEYVSVCMKFVHVCAFIMYVCKRIGLWWVREHVWVYVYN